MSENSITSISSVRPVDPGIPAKVTGLTPAETVAAHKSASPSQEQAHRLKESEPRASGDLSNVSIHFRIDEETEKVTVFVVDRNTKQVLRSIPASELYKLKAGDLLKLTA
jgi:hypothetical protein